jgi:hypothetical protein
MELGRVSFKERDVADLLTLYGINDETERTQLLGLVREANVTGWWQGYGDVLPSWFQTYIGLEEAASLIRVYEVQFVHGLLQTEEYIRAVVALGHQGAPDDGIERRVGLRLERQKLLVAERAPQFTAVMDEAALLRPIGGREVLRGQLRHLLDVADMDNVDVRVLPTEFPGYPAGAAGAFSLLHFPESDLHDVAYVEQLTGAMYIDKRDEVDQYDKAMESLRSNSLSPEATVDRLKSMLRDA